DRQGVAVRTKGLSLTTGFREMPPELLTVLESRLPALLDAKFRSLIVQPRYEQAWKNVQLTFQQFSSATLAKVDKTTQEIDHKTDEVLKRLETIEQSFRDAKQEGRISPGQLQAK